MSKKIHNRKVGTSKNGITPGGKADRQQKRGQRKVDRAIKKGKTLDIAVETDNQELYGNFKLDPKGVEVGKGGWIDEYNGDFSLSNDGVVKKGIHNYSENIPEPYKLHPNQDFVGKIDKKVNFKKLHKRYK